MRAWLHMRILMFVVAALAILPACSVESDPKSESVSHVSDELINTESACPYYFARNTSSATQNYATCEVYLKAGETLVATTCSDSGGDTFLRLFSGDGGGTSEVSSADSGCQCGPGAFGCDVPARLQYTAAAEGWYSLREGCANQASCYATVKLRVCAAGGAAACNDILNQFADP
jgi:hypothetical protein